MDKTYAGMSYEEVVEKYSDYITRMLYGHKMKKQLKIVFKIHL